MAVMKVGSNHEANVESLGWAEETWVVHVSTLLKASSQDSAPEREETRVLGRWERCTAFETVACDCTL